MRVVFPEELESEARRLAREFFAQYDDDDEIPDGAMTEYFNAHASPAYLAFVEEAYRGYEPPEGVSPL
mgnify:CR=1 FL=1